MCSYTQGAQLGACNSGMYYWFYVTTMFCFWISIALMACALSVLCCIPFMFGFLPDDDGNAASAATKSDAQPDVEVGKPTTEQAVVLA